MLRECFVVGSNFLRMIDSKFSMVDTQVAEQSFRNEQCEDFSDARDVLSQPNLRFETSIFIFT